MASDRWFAALNFFKRRKQAYQLFKNTQEGTTFLADLARFCRANETCVVPNDRDKTLVLEGRREVWLRIQNHFGLSPEELLRLYAGPEINAEQ